MNCIWTIKIAGQEYLFNEQQLYSFLLVNGVTNEKELIEFTKSGPFNSSKRSSRHSNLTHIAKTMKDDYVGTTTYTLQSDEGYVFETESKLLTALQWLENHSFIPEFGNILPMRANKEDFAKYAKMHLLDMSTMSEDEVDQYIDNTFKGWETLKKVGSVFHRFLTDITSGHYLDDNDSSRLRFRAKLEEEKYKDLYDLLKNSPTTSEGDLINKFQKFLIQINKSIYSNLKGTEASAFERRHISLVGKIGEDLEKFGVHIDRLFVDNYGKVYVFNYKISNLDSSKWSRNKHDKYVYEMAMIKKTLEQHGLDCTDIEMYNVPIHVDFNEDFSKIINFIKDSGTDGTGYSNTNGLINYITREGDPIMAKVENKMSTWFPSGITIDLSSMDEIEDANNFCKLLCPTVNAVATGIDISAEQWIRQNANTNIKPNYVTNGWSILFDDGSVIEVDDSSPKLNNPKIKEVVAEKIKDLHFGTKDVTSLLIGIVRNSYAIGELNVNGRSVGIHVDQLRKLLAKYFVHKENIEGDKFYEWELVDSDVLATCNMLMFMNKKTKLIDIVSTSAFNLFSKIPFKYLHRENILGHYVLDIDSPVKMSNTYGNLEGLRTIAILNSIKKNLPDDVKLGQVTVISAMQDDSACVMDLNYLNKNFQLLNGYLLNNVDSEYKNSNNLTETDFIEEDEIITQLFKLFISPDSVIPKLDKDEFENVLLGNLNIPSIDELKGNINTYRVIMEYIESKLGKNPETIMRHLDSSIESKRLMARIYERCSHAVNLQIGFEHPDVEFINKIWRGVMKQDNNPDPNVRMVTSLYTRALDNAATLFLNEYTPIRNYINDFYNKKGYSYTNMSVMGAPEAVWEKMFEKQQDENGVMKKTWKFVNPFDPTDLQARQLDKTESDMLKKILFNLAKSREKRKAVEAGLGLKFNYSSENDPNFLDYVKQHLDKEFLYVPLLKGSNAHQNRLFISNMIKKTKSTLQKAGQSSLDDFIKEIALERAEDAKTEPALHRMSQPNKYGAQEEPSIRLKILHQYDESYFEVNLEFLLSDYMANQSISEKIKDVEFESKCVLLELALLGDKEGEFAKKNLQLSVQEIEKFLKINVYERNIMDAFEQKLDKALTPASKLMKRIFLMGNLRAAVRDTCQGFWLNFARSVNHYLTNLTPEYIMKGYTTVFKESIASDKDCNILSELCMRYRLSNTDVSRINERSKIGRNGIFDLENMGFKTMMGPDFLNRMTLMAARCKLDGVWDAFEITKDKLVKYNWKKDKRFEVFAKNDTKNPKYLELKGLYYYYILLYNQDHGTSLTINDALPDPYCEKEIVAIHNLSDSIYGAYDKSKKAMYEYGVLGRNLGVFSTFMNGIVANWFTKPGYYALNFSTKNTDGSFKIEKNPITLNEYWIDTITGHVVEKNGNKFFDKEGNEVQGEFSPKIQGVDVWTCGIWFSIKAAWNVLGKDGLSWEALKEEILSNDVHRKNIYKAASDLGMLLLIGLLFGTVVTPAYKEIHKELSRENAALAGLTEILYNGSKDSYVDFGGPLVIADYLSGSLKPAGAITSIKVLKDMGNTLIGNKTFGELIINDVPMIRSVRETYKEVAKLT